MKFITTNNQLPESLLDQWNAEAAAMAAEFRRKESIQAEVGYIAIATNTEVEYLAHFGVYW